MRLYIVVVADHVDRCLVFVCSSPPVPGVFELVTALLDDEQGALPLLLLLSAVYKLSCTAQLGQLANESVGQMKPVSERNATCT